MEWIVMEYRFDEHGDLIFDDANLFKEIIFDVFPNVEYIDIYTDWNDGQLRIWYR